MNELFISLKPVQLVWRPSGSTLSDLEPVTPPARPRYKFVKCSPVITLLKNGYFNQWLENITLPSWTYSLSSAKSWLFWCKHQKEQHDVGLKLKQTCQKYSFFIFAHVTLCIWNESNGFMCVCVCVFVQVERITRGSSGTLGSHTQLMRKR